MVLALLLGLAATVWSGFELYAVEENAGPLAGLSADALPLNVLANETTRERTGEHKQAEEREDQKSEDGELWEEAHEMLANLMLALVLLHIAGVLFASVSHRENLVRSMVTG